MRSPGVAQLPLKQGLSKICYNGSVAVITLFCARITTRYFFYIIMTPLTLIDIQKLLAVCCSYKCIPHGGFPLRFEKLVCSFEQCTSI